MRETMVIQLWQKPKDYPYSKAKYYQVLLVPKAHWKAIFDSEDRFIKSKVIFFTKVSQGELFVGTIKFKYSW